MGQGAKDSSSSQPGAKHDASGTAYLSHSEQTQLGESAFA
jgi:hypothetical protein